MKHMTLTNSYIHLVLTKRQHLQKYESVIFILINILEIKILKDVAKNVLKHF